MSAEMANNREDRNFMAGYNNTFGPRVSDPEPEKGQFKTSLEIALEKSIEKQMKENPAFSGAVAQGTKLAEMILQLGEKSKQEDLKEAADRVLREAEQGCYALNMGEIDCLQAILGGTPAFPGKQLTAMLSNAQVRNQSERNQGVLATKMPVVVVDKKMPPGHFFVDLNGRIRVPPVVLRESKKKPEKVAEKSVVPDLTQIYLRRIAGQGAR